jgi:hypothetical protein
LCWIAPSCCSGWLSAWTRAIPPSPPCTPTPAAAASAVDGADARVGARNGAGRACRPADQRQDDGSGSCVGHGSCPGRSSNARRPGDEGSAVQNRARVDWGRPTHIVPFIMRPRPVASWPPVGGVLVSRGGANRGPAPADWWLEPRTAWCGSRSHRGRSSPGRASQPCHRERQPPAST